MIGAGLFPLLIYVSSWLLGRGPGLATAVSSVEDFIVLNSACYYESDYVNDNLRLRDLVAASDVIIKAFAGDGNYLRPGGLVASGKDTTTNDGRVPPPGNHHHHNGRRNRTVVSGGFTPEQAPDGHGNEENGNASSISETDFVLRLEPTIVYKGNEVYKKLKLINWQHYVVIKSIAGSKLRRRSPETTTPGSSATTSNISSRRSSKCNRTRLITSNINNSSSSSQASETKQVHAESRTINGTSSSSSTRTMQRDNKLSRSKESSNISNNRQRQSIDDGLAAENNTRELLTVASVFGEILPTELIIFGRLDDAGNLQVDLFRGLLHWDEELQNAIWRELGWSDWSEYTPCSVSCGKGVQQRFRHCLKSPQAQSPAGDDDPAASTRRTGRTMSSTRATPFRRQQSKPKPKPEPYVNIEQHTRKEEDSVVVVAAVMNNENVNPSSLFTTTPTELGRHRQDETPGGGGTDDDEPTMTITTEAEETEEESLEDDDSDDEEQEDGRDEDDDDVSNGAEPPAGRDTPVSTAAAAADLLQPAIERHFNESTNANSGERSIRRRGRRRRQPGDILHNRGSSGGGDKKHITAAATDSGAASVGGGGGFCEGYNIEQRSCNMFECTGSLDLLAASDGHQSVAGGPWDNQFNYRINQMKNNFTLMLNLRSKKWHHSPPTRRQDTSQQHYPAATSTPSNIVSLRSQLANAGQSSSSSLSINFANVGHGGLKVIQEKFGLSEMLPVERNLLDGKWHSVALSGRNGGYIAVYTDCQWANSFVLSRGAIELPQYPVIEAGHDIELGQLTLVPGDTVRLQCATDTIPITDIENRQVTSYFEGIN